MSADWRESRFKRAQIAAIAAVGAPAIAALGASLTWRVEGLAHLQFEGGGPRPIMAFWHGRVLTATYFFRNRGIVVMISANFDGEWIARIIEKFGYGTSRGSTSRGGQRALLKLKRDLANGHPAGFAAPWVHHARLRGDPVRPNRVSGTLVRQGATPEDSAQVTSDNRDRTDSDGRSDR